MTRVAARATLILLCAMLGACADDDRPPPDPGLHGGPRRPLPNIFISPAGEPFRAAARTPYPIAVWFNRADTDHDGRLSRAEFVADGMGFFNKLDANHDGVIDGMELGQYEQVIAPEILPQVEGLHAEEGMDPSLTYGDENNRDNRPDGSGGRGHGRSGGSAAAPVPRGIGVQGAAVYSLENTPEPVAAADAQFDGRITRDEYGKALERRFDLLDKDSLGYLTLERLPKTPIQAEIIKRQKLDAKRGRRGPPPPSPPPS